MPNGGERQACGRWHCACGRRSVRGGGRRQDPRPPVTALRLWPHLQWGWTPAGSPHETTDVAAAATVAPEGQRGLLDVLGAEWRLVLSETGLFGVRNRRQHPCADSAVAAAAGRPSETCANCRLVCGMIRMACCDEASSSSPSSFPSWARTVSRRHFLNLPIHPSPLYLWAFRSRWWRDCSCRWRRSARSRRLRASLRKRRRRQPTTTGSIQQPTARRMRMMPLREWYSVDRFRRRGCHYCQHRRRRGNFQVCNYRVGADAGHDGTGDEDRHLLGRSLRTGISAFGICSRRRCRRDLPDR